MKQICYTDDRGRYYTTWDIIEIPQDQRDFLNLKKTVCDPEDWNESLT